MGPQMCPAGAPACPLGFSLSPFPSITAVLHCNLLKQLQTFSSELDKKYIKVFVLGHINDFLFPQSGINSLQKIPSMFALILGVQYNNSV